jgi:hypothetical protein
MHKIENKVSVLVKRVGYKTLIYGSYGIKKIESLTMMQLLESFRPSMGKQNKERLEDPQ